MVLGMLLRREPPSSTAQEPIQHQAASMPAVHRQHQPPPMTATSDPMPFSTDSHLRTSLDRLQQQLVNLRQAARERATMIHPVHLASSVTSDLDSSEASHTFSPGGNTSGPGSATAAEHELADLCVICMSANKSWLCVPCGHLAMCGPCSAKVKSQTGRCPICREHIREVIKVFRS